MVWNGSFQRWELEYILISKLNCNKTHFSLFQTTTQYYTCPQRSVTLEQGKLEWWANTHAEYAELNMDCPLLIVGMKIYKSISTST